jgi:hypothetical protein
MGRLKAKGEATSKTHHKPPDKTPKPIESEA